MAVRILAEHDENLTDVLNRLRSGPPANLRKYRLAFRAVRAARTHLNQIVALQAAFDFCNNSGCQSICADQYHRIERVRSCLQVSPPGGG